MRRYSSAVIALSWLGLSAPGALAQPAFKDIRLHTPSPELVVDTGARNAACDVVTFTPDGDYLLAVGDDKVVRVWPFSPKEGLQPDRVQSLRWSSFREQRGSIYALALNKTGDRVAITGFGRRNAAAAVLNRGGRVLHGIDANLLPPQGTAKVPPSMWAIALSPSDRQVALGGEDGSVWVWDLDHKAPIRRLGVHPGYERGGKPADTNFVRLLAYVDDKTLSVAADGWVCEWDPEKTDATPRTRFRFDREVGALVTVTLDSRKEWLAAGGQDTKTGLVEVRSLDGKRKKLLTLPPEDNQRPFPRCLAFDPASEKLAVGYYTMRPGASFYHVVGGGVKIFDLTGKEEVPRAGPTLAYYPEALGFHPSGRYLAVAVADNYQVEVHELQRRDGRVSRVVGPGQSLWGVALSKDGNTLVGFRAQRNAEPKTPNHLGRGDWKVFDLRRRTWADSKTSDAFAPNEPIQEKDGWRIVPDNRDASVWYAVSAENKRQKLDLHRSDDKPRCYSFLPGSPVRVAIGHYWGMSVFELGGERPRLVRKFIGHQGEVTSVAPSADGKLLVSASRDQTVCLWRLTAWPNQDEIGASFKVDGDRLTVTAVAEGSPAWEAGLEQGDGITKFSHAEKPVVGGPPAWLKVLGNPPPGQPCVFDIPREKGKVLFRTLTTVRQRPILRLYPMQKNNGWVLWRYHDFYYDTSLDGDFHVGWLFSQDVSKRPQFDPLERYKEKFHRPEKIEELLRDPTTPPERVVIEELEAPRVSIAGAGDLVEVPEGKAVDLELSVEPSGAGKKMAVSSVKLWVNDRQYKEWRSEDGGKVSERISVPAGEMREGMNVITLQGFNAVQARRDQAIVVKVKRTMRSPDLHALMVGVGRYPEAATLGALNADRDAQSLAELWKGQKEKLFAEVHVSHLINRQATSAAILAAIRSYRDKVNPDDVFLLYLGCHGLSDLSPRDKRMTEAIPINTFLFCGHDFDIRKPVTTGVKSNELHQALASLRCRKVILLDACHSGLVGRDPVRSLIPHAVGPVIFSACEHSQKAGELPAARGQAHGFFAHAIRQAAEVDFRRADVITQNQTIEAEELERYVKSAVRELSAKANKEQEPQVFLLPYERSLPLFRR